MFQSIIIEKFINAQDITTLETAYHAFTSRFHDLDFQANIKQSKEEQYQEGFLRDLFVQIFGYTLNPTTGYNLTTELKNLKNSKKADGAVLKDGNAVAVIELKGMDTTDLSRIEAQAFGYKNNHPTCRYVITSNFQKLRFYIDNAVEFLEFDLFKLDFEQFKLLYLLLNCQNLLADIPLKLKSESISQEQKVTQALYQDYSRFKRALFDDLVTLNPSFDPLTLFQKSQKLLDRLLFIFFAEDSGLLNANTAHTMLQEWEQTRKLKLKMSVYDHLKHYFGYLNTGYKDENSEIFAYNGGLFKPDDVLDNVLISDEILYTHIKKLADYNFASEIDVNILGHIFENSLSEIDEIKAELNGETLDKTQTKRKKDGVFYTPKYITSYIVQNTVGKLCTDKKAEFGIVDELYISDKKRQKKTQEDLLNRLKTYRAWLLDITICDPACGSGAFLNEALNFLMAEHAYLDELESKLFGGGLVFQEVRNHILEHNLFGVDINPESVEIAKLSLWLRTAEPHRKLSNLNENLMCGNSLIDDVAVAGDRAFDWEKAFPQVFANGGFDVIIGNPPYVKLEQIKAVSEQLAKMNYETFEKRGDLYVLFVEKGFNLLKENGLISFIMPNKWLQAGYGKSLRKYFLERNLEKLIDFGDLQIFEGATTYPCIFVAEKSQPTENIEISVLKSALQMDFINNIQENLQVFNHADFDENTWVISSTKDKEILEKLNNNLTSLKEFIGGDAYYGVKAGLSEAFFIDENVKNQMDNDAEKFIFPFVQGRDIKRYLTPNDVNYLIRIEKGFSKLQQINDEKSGELFLEENYPSLFGWLEPHKEKAKKRTDKGDYWWELRACDYYSKFAQPKIMYQTFQVSPCFIYDDKELYCNNSMWIIPTDNKGLLAVLNSKMGWWLISKYCTQIQNGYQLIWKSFGQIPVPTNLDELSIKADEMLRLNKQLQDVQSKFLRTLDRKFNLTDPSKNLQNWHTLTYKDFTKELAKKKIKLTLADEAEWEDYFIAQQKTATDLQTQINQTDQQINQMVYQLYGLNEDEINIIENG
ncbi:MULTISPECIES: Eco57I restriction-modification methylase domain-containing protein [unclassified Moraxella]|uniref:Eco57I restriction-modification methylase domain-containing protein n=1 Tax=unclassified Moraxella TaxID=2685852 RepID=UPI003AF7C27F